MPIVHAFARADDVVATSIFLIFVVVSFGVAVGALLVLLAAQGSFCIVVGAMAVEGGFRISSNLIDLLRDSS